MGLAATTWSLVPFVVAYNRSIADFRKCHAASETNHTACKNTHAACTKQQVVWKRSHVASNEASHLFLILGPYDVKLALSPCENTQCKIPPWYSFLLAHRPPGSNKSAQSAYKGPTSAMQCVWTQPTYIIYPLHASPTLDVCTHRVPRFSAYIENSHLPLMHIAYCKTVIPIPFILSSQPGWSIRGLPLMLSSFSWVMHPPSLLLVP